MKYINTKKGFILLNTSIAIIFMLLLVGTYLRYTTTVTSIEFQKDLAKLRGYWATYGAKEQEDNMIYVYYDSNLRNKIYDINVKYTYTTLSWPFSGKKDLKFSWELNATNNSGIDDNLIYTRTLEVYDYLGTGSYDLNKTKSYIK